MTIYLFNLIVICMYVFYFILFSPDIRIIPQAFFTKFGLAAGAKLIWLVKFFIVIFSPVAYPLSILIEKIMGSYHGIQYSRKELKELVIMLAGNQLNTDEVRIMTGALEIAGELFFSNIIWIISTQDIHMYGYFFSHLGKRPEQIMIPLDDVYMLEIHTKIDHQLLTEVKDNPFFQ